LLLGTALLVLGGVLALVVAVNGVGDDGTPPAPEAVLPIETDGPLPSPTQTPARRMASGQPPVRIVIPAIAVDAEVMVLGMDAQGVPQVPDRTNSRQPGQVVAWYDFSAQPGQGSNAVFAGHVTWDRAPAVFWALGRLSPGDQVQVVLRGGSRLLYQVTETFMVDPAQPDAIRVMYPTTEDMVTLITCGGTFVPDRTSPLGGDYTRRVVVRAKLVGAE